MVKFYLKNSLKLFCLNLNGRQEIMTAAMQIPNRASSSRMLCNLRFVFLPGSNAGHFTTFKDAPFHKSHPYFPELFPCLCFHLNSLQNCKGEKTNRKNRTRKRKLLRMRHFLLATIQMGKSYFFL